MKTKPFLSPPDQYIEIGLWRQVMKINQQLCQKMEQLDQDEGCKVCVMIIYFWQGINQFEQLIKLNKKISEMTALKYYWSARPPVSLIKAIASKCCLWEYVICNKSQDCIYTVVTCKPEIFQLIVSQQCSMLLKHNHNQWFFIGQI